MIRDSMAWLGSVVSLAMFMFLGTYIFVYQKCDRLECLLGAADGKIY